MTLDSAGQPAVWEVLADSSGAELIFVSQGLESAAVTEFGKPRPGRRFSIERAVEEAPEVVVARVIGDGPRPMGPIVYLSATHSVSTLICRCMESQAKKLRATSTYGLTALEAGDSKSFWGTSPARPNGSLAFWPGDKRSETRLQRCLRLPAAF